MCVCDVFVWFICVRSVSFFFVAVSVFLLMCVVFEDVFVGVRFCYYLCVLRLLCLFVCAWGALVCICVFF